MDVDGACTPPAAVARGSLPPTPKAYRHPSCCMQFMVVWPWLDSELEAYGSFYVHDSKDPGVSASAGQGMPQPSLGGSARPSKRQRVMGPTHAVPIVLG